MRKKSGFSLMEILLVLGIISVILSMGISISKKNVEKAYNQYWYTGYNALSDATADASIKGILNKGNLAGTLSTYSKYVGETLMRSTDYKYGNGVANFTAPNGINYLIEPFAKTNSAGETKEYYRITMTIPKPNQKKVYKNKSIFIYTPEVANGYVYPSFKASATNSDTYIVLHNRADLLPFYIVRTEDSALGGNIVHNFYGFNKAYCKAYELHSISDMDDANIDCSTTTPSEILKGLIVSANPRKVF